MKKLMVVLACAAAAVGLTGCGSSPEGVAEDFAEALLKGKGKDAVECYGGYFQNEPMTKAQHKKLVDEFDKLAANDEDLKTPDLDLELYYVKYDVITEHKHYLVVNGDEFTGETATVVYQCVKDGTPKKYGIEVNLAQVNGDWIVTGKNVRKDLDTEE
ncbi:MAG: hypothetical protein K6F50_06695 [Kiritimatiellae bacterium]|nr:hypothetical protein [Kiritimatiellia bacterium]